MENTQQNKKKGISPMIIVILVVVLALSIYVVSNVLFVFAGGKPILRGSLEADLRDLEMTEEEYHELKAQLKDTHLLWNIPIGGEVYECTAGEITISSLTEDQIPLYNYFDNLQQINAWECTDYDALLKLQEALPGCTIHWGIHLGDAQAPITETNLKLENAGVTAGELISKIGYFENLETVSALDVAFTAQERADLRAAYPDTRFFWNMEVAGKTWLSTEKVLSYAGAKPAFEELLTAAEWFYNVEEMDLSGCGFTVEELLQLQEAYGSAVIHSELTVFGKTFTTEDVEIDFSGITMEDTAAVEQFLPLMNSLEKVIMCDCGISNEDMDALGQRHPEVRFVWTVKIGRSTLRTDATGFIGAKHGYIPNANIRDPYKDASRRLFDEDCENFKYCIDMVCLDLGHMGVADYSFLNYMPKLKYLILADTQGTDFSMVANLPELIYLELFMTDFNQTEILLNLKNLKNLNLGFTGLTNLDPLKEMTWLEMLWLPGNHISTATYKELQEALPNTTIDYLSKDSTSNGWRKSQLYYDMRDLLGMYYLS
ncbi:MAG: hypothetical protein IKJ99_08070 [Oscillospiraceae bacterium]|nr:hypothetical protein [Oscillospiraceae bacterium]